MNILRGKDVVVVDAHQLLWLLEKLYNTTNIHYLGGTGQGDVMTAAGDLIRTCKSIVENDE